MEKLQDKVEELEKTVKEIQSYVDYQLQDVQLADRGQLAFPLTQNTISVLDEWFDKSQAPSVYNTMVSWSNAVTTGFVKKHFYSKSVLMNMAPVTVDLPYDPVSLDDPLDTNSGAWLVADTTVYMSFQTSADPVNVSKISIDGAGNVTYPLSQTVSVPNMYTTDISTAPGNPDQVTITCNDPNYVGIINCLMFRSYTATGWKT